MAHDYDLENQDKLLDHEYDGIRELDNRLPPWWLNLFYISIGWGFIYMLYFHVFGIGDLSEAEYYKEINPNYVASTNEVYRPFLLTGTYHSPLYEPNADVTPLMMAQMGGMDDLLSAATVEEADTIEYTALTDAESLAGGKSIFMQNCVSCHGQLGEGGIGPNLTDDYWLHGDGGITGIVRTVRNGVPIKGMIAWKTYLKPEQILEVGSYVLTLQGTSPPNPKAPQGTKID